MDCLKNIWRCVLTELDGHQELQCRIWREGLVEVRVHVYHIPAPPAGHKSCRLSEGLKWAFARFEPTAHNGVLMPFAISV